MIQLHCAELGVCKVLRFVIGFETSSKQECLIEIQVSCNGLSSDQYTCSTYDQFQSLGLWRILCFVVNDHSISGPAQNGCSRAEMLFLQIRDEEKVWIQERIIGY